MALDPERPGRTFATVLRLWDMSQLEAPAEALTGDYRRAGVGVGQSAASDAPSITVVLILAP